MNQLEIMGRWIAAAGVTVVILGGVVWLLGKLKIFDHLPGILKVEGKGFTIIIPILACIVVSVVLTLVVNLILRIVNR